ncbi:hypothetical protein QOZ80_6AG0536790 [Eleusine coracana subsp. coracana]|nr:hypothetical protein QOZ80_6AG0536790 [Eleusine coracana subsp. coracana]
MLVSPQPRKNMRGVAALPDDIIFDVLSRLPTKSVIRCKSVCKAWFAMVSSQHFVSAHLELSKVRSSILVVSRAYLEWGREDMDAVCMGFFRYNGGSEAELVHSENIARGIACWASPLHCDGLVLVSTQNHEIVACNPATREFITLPKGSNSLNKTRVGFGFDRCNNKYKAARFFYQMDNETAQTVCKFEVLTLGTAVWRQTIDPPYPILGITPAYMQGSLFWRINLPPLKHPKVFIQFNLVEEKFGLTPYPPSKAEPIYFVELEGGLCCACFTEKYEVVEIWIYSEMQIWTQYCTIQIPEDIIVALPGHGVKIPKIIFDRDDLLLFRENSDRRTRDVKRVVERVNNFTYHSKDKGYKIYLGNELACHAVNYVDSMVRIGGYM